MSWVSETFPARRPPNFTLVRLHCPQKTHDVECGAELLPRPVRWPTAWNVYAVAITDPLAASGRGPIAQCPRCARLAEIVIHGPPT